jgi:hypothetical protein
LYDRYRPFCGECGHALPSEQKLQAMGLTIYASQYGRPIRDVDQIAMCLHNLGAARYWLEEYHPSFRTTKIRIQKSGERECDYELVCTSTTRLEIPIGDGWCGELAVKRDPDGAHWLSDTTNGVSVMAENISLHKVSATDFH